MRFSRAVEVYICDDDITRGVIQLSANCNLRMAAQMTFLQVSSRPATIDIDLMAIFGLTKAREHSVALVGPAAEELFDPVPEQDSL